MKSFKLSISNISTALLVIFALLLFFSPDAKGLLIQALMNVGLFQPDVEEERASENLLSTPSGIQFKDGSGNITNLSDLKGKVVFINFWATWCPPCRAEMPSIETLYQQSQDKNIVFLMVDVDDDYKKSKKFIDKKKFTLPVFTPASSIPKSMLSGSIPTTIILNKKGQVVFQHEGAADYTNKQVVNLLDKLSKE